MRAEHVPLTVTCVRQVLGGYFGDPTERTQTREVRVLEGLRVLFLMEGLPLFYLDADKATQAVGAVESTNAC